MNRTKRYILSAILAITLLVLPTAVFAKELGSLTISGPGIKGEMNIDHQGGMRKLEGSGFFDQPLSVKPPENLGEGYQITAYLNLDGKVVPFVQMVYYAADVDQPGYVHYTARLNGESLQPVDQWGRLNKDAYEAFRGLMGMYNIELQPAFSIAPAAAAPAIEPAKSEEQAPVRPASVPSVASEAIPQQTYYLGAALAASILILLGAGVLLRRRTASRSA